MRNFLVLMFICIISISGVSQIYNQKVPFEVCRLVFDTAECFYVDSMPIAVGEHVTTLDAGFRYCLSALQDSTSPPIKVIIAIDRSGSMESNDASNMRIKAANQFIDSLKGKSPNSYVGIITFAKGVKHKYGPVPLNDNTMFQMLHNTIDAGATFMALNKTFATYQGVAVDTCLSMLEKIKDTLPNARQHVILLTDDGWFEDGDIEPRAVLQKYRPRFPSNSFPKIHSVILTLSGEPQVGGVQGLQNVKMIADSTNGTYIENATPQTIVSNFMNLLEKMATSMEKLLGVNLKNIATNESQVMKIEFIQGAPNDYIISGSSPLNLKSGDNFFVFEKTLLMKDSSTSISYDTLKIVRSSSIQSDTLSVISRLERSIELVDLSFTALPDSLLVNEKVSSIVQIDPAFKFPYDLTDVVVSAFTVNNSAENSNISLFNLDSNINNLITSGNPAIGSPDFNKSVGAFGGSMKDGSFNTSVKIPASDFSFDFWIYNTGSSNKTLVSSSKFSLFINESGIFSFSSGSDTLKATNKVYSKVWSNVAISRQNGAVSIFVNGVLASNSKNIDISGDNTIKVEAGSGISIDELRFSSISNVKETTFGKFYSIAQITGMNWTMDNINAISELLNVPPAKWVNNSVNFSFTRNSSAQVIINMTRFDSRMSWSVNSNPVEFSSPWPSPIPVEAIVMDNNGNGFIDQVKFTIPDTSILIEQMPSPGDLFGQLKLVTFSNENAILGIEKIERIDDHSFMVTLNENSGINFETGWKSADFSIKQVSIIKTGAFLDIVRIVDKAGPVISKAILVSGEGDDAKRIDTLNVLFSEPLQWHKAASTSPQDVLNYYHFSDKITDALNKINPADIRISEDKLSIRILLTNGYIVKPGEDSLQLKAVIDLLTDQTGNAAHISSRIAPIEGSARLKFIPVKVVLLDLDGDGFLDNIEVYLPEDKSFSPKLPSAKDFFTAHSLETYMGNCELHPEALVIVDQHTVKIALKENTGAIFETGWIKHFFEIAKIPMTTDGLGLIVGEVVDKAGPVITKANFEFSPDGKSFDIIKIQFSEPVDFVKEDNSLPAEMLNYFQQGILSPEALESIQAKSFVLSSDGKSAVLTMTNGFTVLPLYDSLQLKNAPDRLIDNSGNGANKQSRIAVIEGNAKSVINIVPSSNPYTPGTQLPENIQKIYSKGLNDGKQNVVLIGIKSTLPLKKILGTDSYGDVDIYDCVGNIIRRNIHVYMITAKNYCFTWDAKNSKKRTVGDGVYLVSIKVIDFNNIKHVFKYKIGIK